MCRCHNAGPKDKIEAPAAGEPGQAPMEARARKND